VFRPALAESRLGQTGNTLARSSLRITTVSIPAPMAIRYEAPVKYITSRLLSVTRAPRSASPQADQCATIPYLTLEGRRHRGSLGCTDKSDSAPISLRTRESGALRQRERQRRRERLKCSFLHRVRYQAPVWSHKMTTTGGHQQHSICKPVAA
jgi:hypothetical protein